MYQDTVTLFNFYEDKKKGICKWYPTVLENVELQISRGVTVTKDGNSNDNNATLHIRQIDDYVPPIAYKKLEDKAGVFTLKPEDFFVEGNITDIVIDEDDYPDGFFEYAKRNYDNVFQITTIERFKAIPHFEVGGK